MFETTSSFQFMPISKVVTQLVDFGKEAFEMARKGLLRSPTQVGLTGSGLSVNIEACLIIMINEVVK